MRSFLAQTEAAGDAGAGWYCWYAVSDEDGERTLVGCGGFLGAPDATGTVETGYSICEEERGNGYATEMLGVLIGYAFTNGATKIIAHTKQSNPASIAVLNNNDFEQDSVGSDGQLEFVLSA
jgi:ribosomal-protein-alanine N-acetyltransferase